MTPEDHWQELNEIGGFWDRRQFTVADVCGIASTSPKALEHFVDPKRDLVSLDEGATNPGKGRRRLFSASEVLKINAAFTMSQVGFPQRWSRILTEEVSRRALLMDVGLSEKTEMVLATYPIGESDWGFTAIYKEDTKEPHLPMAVLVLQADMLIEQTKAQLQAIIEGSEMPAYKFQPTPPPDNPFGPKSNFMKLWEKDASGAWKYVGLTLAETQELMEIEGVVLDGDDLKHVDPAPKDGPNPRYLELQGRREFARMKAIGAKFDDE